MKLIEESKELKCQKIKIESNNKTVEDFAEIWIDDKLFRPAYFSFNYSEDDIISPLVHLFFMHSKESKYTYYKITLVHYVDEDTTLTEEGRNYYKNLQSFWDFYDNLN